MQHSETADTNGGGCYSRVPDGGCSLGCLFPGVDKAQGLGVDNEKGRYDEEIICSDGGDGDIQWVRVDAGFQECADHV